MGQPAHKIRMVTVAPDRRVLRNEMLALYEQYERELAGALDILKQGEELIRGARAEKRASKLRMGQLKKVLDDEYPDWSAENSLSGH